MRRTIRRQVRSEDEINLVFILADNKPIAQLRWESDDEFVFNGQMYDVIEKKVGNGKLVIRCLPDKNETALVDKMKNNSKENERSNKTAGTLFQFLQTLYYSSGSEEFACGETVQYDLSGQAQKLPSLIRKIPTPPPQVSGIISFLS